MLFQKWDRGPGNAIIAQSLKLWMLSADNVVAAAKLKTKGRVAQGWGFAKGTVIKHSK